MHLERTLGRNGANPLGHLAVELVDLVRVLSVCVVLVEVHLAFEWFVLEHHDTFAAACVLFAGACHRPQLRYLVLLGV